MLSSKAKYGLRAALALAERPKDEAWVSVAEIIRVIDGPIALTPCASRTGFRACTDCADVKSCQLRAAMLRSRDTAAAVLENCSLADPGQVPELADARGIGYAGVSRTRRA